MKLHVVPSLKKSMALASLFTGLLFGAQANATIVQFQTVMGNFEVNLFDHDPATKATVENFLKYVEGAEGYGNYANTIIHRTVDDFVVQGGGYSYDGSLPLNTVESADKITNQPVYSNLRGTLAMAKTASGPNTATNQWFINTEDNSEALDNNNGGFTVFGQVIGNGMDVVDAIAEVDRFNMGGVFKELPLRNYTAQDNENKVTPDGDNFVIVTNIVVLDANTDTAATLNPTKNTLVGKGGGSSGNSSLWLLSLLSLLVLARKRWC